MYIRVSNGYVRRHKIGSGLKISPSNVEKLTQAIKSISLKSNNPYFASLMPVAPVEKQSKPKLKQYIKF